jgi:hypothetical protein
MRPEANGRPSPSMHPLGFTWGGRFLRTSGEQIRQHRVAPIVPYPLEAASRGRTQSSPPSPEAAASSRRTQPQPLEPVAAANSGHGQLPAELVGAASSRRRQAQPPAVAAASSRRVRPQAPVPAGAVDSGGEQLLAAGATASSGRPQEGSEAVAVSSPCGQSGASLPTSASVELLQLLAEGAERAEVSWPGHQLMQPEQEGEGGGEGGQIANAGVRRSKHARRAVHVSPQHLRPWATSLSLSSWGGSH